MTPARRVMLGVALGSLAVGAAVALVALGTDDHTAGTVRVTLVVEGMAPPDATFRVAVACTRDGGAKTRHDLSFSSGTRRAQVVRGIELPARCTVAQVDGAGATLVEYAAGGSPSTKRPTFRLDERRAPDVRVTVTNSFPSSTAIGTLTITKKLVGSPPPAARFVVRVTCDSGFETEVEFPAFGGDQEVPIILDLAGTTCGIEEIEGGGASEVQYSPSQHDLTLDLETPTLAVTITNGFG